MKKFLMPALALIIAVSLSAFTHKSTVKKPNATGNWYIYKGPLPSTTTSVVVEGNYELGEPQDCESDQNLCAIFVPGTGTNPDQFDSQTQADLENAQRNHDPVPDYILMKE